jgi:hypothetical protein
VAKFGKIDFGKLKPKVQYEFHRWFKDFVQQCGVVNVMANEFSNYTKLLNIALENDEAVTKSVVEALRDAHFRRKNKISDVIRKVKECCDSYYDTERSAALALREELPFFEEMSKELYDTGVRESVDQYKKMIEKLDEGVYRNYVELICASSVVKEVQKANEIFENIMNNRGYSGRKISASVEEEKRARLELNGAYFALLDKIERSCGSIQDSFRYRSFVEELTVRIVIYENRKD